MNLDAWSTLSITAAHFEIESEVVLALVAAGYRVEFVPICVIYRDEKSKIHPIRDTVRWLRWYVLLCPCQPLRQPVASALRGKSRNYRFGLRRTGGGTLYRAG